MGKGVNAWITRETLRERVREGANREGKLGGG